MFTKEDKKSLCCHGVLAWVIVALLGLIFIVLVFKAGMMVGKTKSHFYSCKKSNVIWQYKSKADYEKFRAGAAEKGMTDKEYKEYLESQKK